MFFYFTCAQVIAVISHVYPLSFHYLISSLFMSFEITDALNTKLRSQWEYLELPLVKLLPCSVCVLFRICAQMVLVDTAGMSHQGHEMVKLLFWTS